MYNSECKFYFYMIEHIILLSLQSVFYYSVLTNINDRLQKQPNQIFSTNRNR